MSPSIAAAASAWSVSVARCAAVDALTRSIASQG